jgi:hypothetical protein
VKILRPTIKSAQYCYSYSSSPAPATATALHNRTGFSAKLKLAPALVNFGPACLLHLSSRSYTFLTLTITRTFLFISIFLDVGFLSILPLNPTSHPLPYPASGAPLLCFPLLVSRCSGLGLLGSILQPIRLSTPPCALSRSSDL